MAVEHLVQVVDLFSEQEPQELRTRVSFDAHGGIDRNEVKLHRMIEGLA